MKIKLWGTRGSLACPGEETMKYGGNTSCIEVRGEDGTILILDAGTGIRKLGLNIGYHIRRVDILLTHLHLDHVLGLGFFAPLYNPEMEVHLYGPNSAKASLGNRLSRYLSPPLFPVHLAELPCKLFLHEVPGDFEVGPFHIYSAMVCHPGRTVGYRIQSAEATIAYIPDHEPALGHKDFPSVPEWTSGFELAMEADILVHDSQYSENEYLTHVGWGHSSIEQAAKFAGLVGAKSLLPFHHDPSHTDEIIDKMIYVVSKNLPPGLKIINGGEGDSFTFD